MDPPQCLGALRLCNSWKWVYFKTAFPMSPAEAGSKGTDRNMSVFTTHGFRQEVPGVRVSFADLSDLFVMFG